MKCNFCVSVRRVFRKSRYMICFGTHYGVKQIKKNKKRGNDIIFFHTLLRQCQMAVLHEKRHSELYLVP